MVRAKSRSYNAKNLVLVLLLILSLLLNISLTFLYFIKLRSYSTTLRVKVEELQSKLNNLEGGFEEKDCQRVYSKSEGKVVCLSDEELKARALSECSKTVMTMIDKSEGLQIDDLKKTRDLLMEVCMEGKGYEYE